MAEKLIEIEISGQRFELSEKEAKKLLAVLEAKLLAEVIVSEIASSNNILLESETR
jgi:hypothetical protein